MLASTRETFERAQAQRANVLTAQFRNEFKRRGQETVRTVDGDRGVGRGAQDRAAARFRRILRFRRSARPIARAGPAGAGRGRRHHRQQRGVAGALRLQGRVADSGEDWNQRGAFLRREELEQRVTLSLVAVAVAAEGDRKLYVVGGQELDRRVPGHAGAAGGHAGAAVPQSGAAVLAGGTDRRGGTGGARRTAAAVDRARAAGAPRGVGDNRQRRGGGELSRGAAARAGREHSRACC